MVVTIITLIVTIIKGIVDWREFNKKNKIELSSKTKLKWVEQVREIIANFSKSYRIMVVTNSISEVQTEKEKAYANFLHDAYLLKLYFASYDKNTSELDLSGEYDRNYYKDEINNNKEELEQCEKQVEVNENVLAPLYNPNSNVGKVVLINQLLKQFIDIASEEKYRNIDEDPMSKYSPTLKQSNLNFTSRKYFDRILKILEIYLQVEEEEARNGK